MEIEIMPEDTPILGDVEVSTWMFTVGFLKDKIDSYLEDMRNLSPREAIDFAFQEGSKPAVLVALMMVEGFTDFKSELEAVLLRDRVDDLERKHKGDNDVRRYARDAWWNCNGAAEAQHEDELDLRRDNPRGGINIRYAKPL
jgi:hypothetical protein